MSSLSLSSSMGTFSSGGAARPSAVFSSSTSDTAAPMCWQIVSQAVQLNFRRLRAAAMVVIVATALPPAAGKLHAEQVAAEVDVALDVDFEVRSLADQLGPVGPQELAGPQVGQPRQPVPQGEVFGLFDFRVPRGGRHD